MIHALWTLVHRFRRHHWPARCYYNVRLCCPACDHPAAYAPKEAAP